MVKGRTARFELAVNKTRPYLEFYKIIICFQFILFILAHTEIFRGLVNLLFGEWQQNRSAELQVTLTPMHWKVEIPIEVQLNNDNAFLDEFASQPEPGQSSKSRSDSESDTSIDLEISTLLSQENVDSVEESPVHVQTKIFFKN